MVRPDNPELFVQPVEIVRLRVGGTHAAGAPPKPVSKAIALAQRHAAVGLMVVLPTILAVMYFGLIAAARYETEAKFVVRGPSSATTSEIANLVQGSGIVRSADDSYVVLEYMVSRDAMRHLMANAGLLDVFNRREADFLWRYPGWFWGPSEEHLFRHYLKFVSTAYDETTGISTLSVQAFRPSDAQKIADALLRDAESLVNKLNERAQADAIELASREVTASKTHALDEQAKVTAFRTRTSVIDPNLVSQEALETIARLSLEQAQTSAALAEMMKSSPQSPQILSLRLRVTALEDQINKERLRLAGNGSTSMVPLLAEYERLMLERQFADRTFVSALNMLEAARVDALRQRFYLDRISNPSVPDYATYPYRLISIVGTFLLCSMLYRVARAFGLDTLAHSIR